MTKSNSVYKILCTTTGKVYIGQTCNLRTRQKRHFKTLQRGTHHNTHLQRAYDKYGQGAFVFEIVEQDIPNLIIDKREQYWIDQFDSIATGYNQRMGGNLNVTPTNARPCTWNGKQYPSMAAAARDVGIGEYRMSTRLKKGYFRDADMQRKNQNKKRFIVWDGVEYTSISEASRATGIPTSTISRRIHNGDASSDSIKNTVGTPKPCEWNGISYKSVQAAAKACGIDPSSMRDRLAKGYTHEYQIKKQYLRKKTA